MSRACKNLRIDRLREARRASERRKRMAEAGVGLDDEESRKRELAHTSEERPLLPIESHRKFLHSNTIAPKKDVGAVVDMSSVAQCYRFLWRESQVAADPEKRGRERRYVRKSGTRRRCS
ncbi:hypothetical protein R3P38DRAFT_2786397 [Favolaschia claudopus]|uniref:Uncharacterized protein n=1 Tax=Favolaschia claudopus TaxID=2862362 RepID=A0AAW0ATN2_9AGAR